MEQTKTVFITVFLFAHGYASMIANNSLEPAVAAVSNQKIDTILNTGYFDTTFIQFHQLIGLNN